MIRKLMAGCVLVKELCRVCVGSGVTDPHFPFPLGIIPQCPTAGDCSPGTAWPITSIAGLSWSWERVAEAILVVNVTEYGFLSLSVVVIYQLFPVALPYPHKEPGWWFHKQSAICFKEKLSLLRWLVLGALWASVCSHCSLSAVPLQQRPNWWPRSHPRPHGVRCTTQCGDHRPHKAVKRLQCDCFILRGAV